MWCIDSVGGHWEFVFCDGDTVGMGANASDIIPGGSGDHWHLRRHPSVNRVTDGVGRIVIVEWRKVDEDGYE